MIYAHIVLSSPPDITDDPHREISEFIKLLSRKSSCTKKIFGIPYIPKAHMFCITLEHTQTDSKVYLLWKMYVCYGRWVSTMENTEDLLYREILKFGFILN